MPIRSPWPPSCCRFGAIGDRLGRRNVLIVGTVVFGAASLAASFADSTSTLIVWRAVMGVGAAMIMPGTLSTITATFPPDQRAKGVATWSGFAAAGAIIGMLAAGALLEQFSWRSIFVASAAVSLAAASVRHSAAAGLHVAHQLGARGTALADGVKSAFIDRLSASVIAVSVVVAAAAVGAVLRAPKTPPTAD